MIYNFAAVFQDVSRNRSFPVFFGLNSRDSSENVLIRFISRIYCHKNYAAFYDTFRNDICIFRLSEKITQKDAASLQKINHVCFSRQKCQKHLCLPAALEKLENFEAKKKNQECVVAGFGFTKNYTSSNPPILQETVVKFYNYEKCAKWNENWNLFFGEHLCFGMKVSLTQKGTNFLDIRILVINFSFQPPTQNFKPVKI